jgi:AAHS family 4-hydroxybenzoate transporter-like MFS transporter
MAIAEGKGGTPVVDVAEFIDQQPVGGFQIRLLLTCAVVLFLDGFDTQAIGYVAPALAKEWGLTKSALGPVFSAGLFGLMIGALVFGPLADRIGRKKIIIFSTLAFGLGTLITAFVQDVNTLLAIRFLTGLGLGGAMPNAIAMTSEFNPRRRRATMVMIMFCGFSVGAALGGLLAAALFRNSAGVRCLWSAALRLCCWFRSWRCGCRNPSGSSRSRDAPMIASRNCSD